MGRHDVTTFTCDKCGKAIDPEVERFSPGGVRSSKTRLVLPFTFSSMACSTTCLSEMLIANAAALVAPSTPTASKESKSESTKA